MFPNKQFEERFKHYNLSTKIDATGSVVYANPWTQGAWVGFQFANNLAAADGRITRREDLVKLANEALSQLDRIDKHINNAVEKCRATLIESNVPSAVEWSKAQARISELESLLAASAAPIDDAADIALSNCIVEIRNLIKVSHDYDMDEMQVQALITAIECIQLRKGTC